MSAENTPRWSTPPGAVVALAAGGVALAVAAATAVDAACAKVTRAVEMSLSEVGPDIEQDRDPATGIPRFILRA